MLINHSTNIAVKRLMLNVPDCFIADIQGWYEYVHNGLHPYPKPYSPNTIRIYLSADVNHTFKYLKPDYSNIQEAVLMAMSKCQRDQYSLKKDILDSSISLTKYLIQVNKLSEDVLNLLRAIKLKRLKEVNKTVVREKLFYDLDGTIKINFKEEKQRLYLVIIYILYFTGMRLSEVANLETKDIDFHRDTIYLRNRKGGKNTLIGLNSKLKPVLLDYLSKRKFSNRKQVLINLSGEPLSRDYIGKAIKKLSDLSNEKFSPHSFRRGLATYAIERNVPVAEVQQILGHADYKTTLSYYCPDKEAVVRKMVNW